MTSALELLKQLDEKYPGGDMSTFAEAQNKLNNLGANIPQINWKITPEETALINKIVERATLLDTNNIWSDDLNCMMDITATHNSGCPLDLQALLDFDDYQFMHDVFGIARHLNRKTGQLGNCFLPRSAR